jgi:biopolymer transport protein ExbD
MKAKIKKNAVKADINIAPFTDVILVLLIVFMVAMPSVEHHIEVNLPKTDTSDKIAVPSEPIDALISSDGISLNGKLVSIDEVEEIVKAKLKEDPGKSVVIKGDQKVEYDQIMQFMDRAKKAGATKFALAVDAKSV